MPFIQQPATRDAVRVYLEEEMADVIFLKNRAVGVDRQRLDAELDRLIKTWKDLCELKK
jgi:hypothetical protein